MSFVGHFFFLMWAMIAATRLNSCRSCVREERKGLLELKDYLISLKEEDSLPILQGWTNKTESDCCSWEGIKCNRSSRRVIALAIHESIYSENSILDLSLLHPFEELRSLNLSDNWFDAWFDNKEGYKSLARLRNLEILDVAYCYSNNSILPFLNAASTLKTLILRGNEINGGLPVEELNNLTDLEVLDLSENELEGLIPRQELFFKLRKLEALDLSGNMLSGSLDGQGICKLKNLQELDLSHNNISGQLPSCFSSLTELRVLDISSNQMTGKVPYVISSLKSLEYVSMSDNNFEGIFSFTALANLSRLKVFKLSTKSNSLHVNMQSLLQPKFQLSVLSLQYCNLEKFPNFLLYQSRLRLIDLSSNRLSGAFSSWLLENNTNLEVLILQNNSLTSLQLPSVVHNLLFLDISANKFNQRLPRNIGWLLPHLKHMNISKNGFKGNLPASIGRMEDLYFLDLSHNNFDGKLPQSLVMGCYSMAILMLSHNNLSGEIFQESSNLTSLAVLNMNDNRFTGKIGDGLINLISLHVVDMSNNYLTGSIPSWIANLDSVNAILLSNNLLEGEIPSSLFRMSLLGLLDLSANMLSGTIPPRFYNPQRFVVLLHLQDNKLTGSIPDTLLENVTALDLRNNKLSGHIPEFTNSTSINILLLRGNNLTGHIPWKLCNLSSIKLLDLSHNRLNGSIPSCLNNISFGLGKEDEPLSFNFDLRIWFSGGFGDDTGSGSVSESNLGKYYKSLLVLDALNPEYGADADVDIQFAAKHRYDAYMGVTLGHMFGLDLSDNELSGEIPNELGGLMQLRALNLSHNYLSSAIPESFSSMRDLESLDISFNRLDNRIPSELEKLSSLAVFNVSYNNLSGAIPRGGQFDTFDESSYIGNPLLCGKPTSKSCNDNGLEAPNTEMKEDGGAIDMVSFYWSVAATYITVILGNFALLCLNSPWRRTWFRFIDYFVYKVRSMLS